MAKVMSDSVTFVLKEKANEFRRRFKQMKTFSMTHQEVLDLTAPSYHHELLRTAAKVANVSASQGTMEVYVPYVLDGIERPLVVFTPKSMLRLKAASSAPQDFTTGTFRPVIADPGALDAAAVTRVLLCSGKVVYDLEAERSTRADTQTAIVRVEQLYPVPGAEAAQAATCWVPSALKAVVW